MLHCSFLYHLFSEAIDEATETLQSAQDFISAKEISKSSEKAKCKREQEHLQVAVHVPGEGQQQHAPGPSQPGLRRAEPSRQPSACKHHIW